MKLVRAPQILLKVTLVLALAALAAGTVPAGAAPSQPAPQAQAVTYITYMPIISTNVPGLFGRVTEKGVPVAGISLELRFWDGSAWSTVSTVVTDSQGKYAFTPVAALAAGQQYFVRYRNGANLNRLSMWQTRTLTTYGPADRVSIGDFDVTNVELGNPKTGISVVLPYTFTWTPRASVPTDNYEFDLREPNLDNPYFRSSPLGHVNSYLMSARPAGFNLKTDYLWWTAIIGPDGGYGWAFWGNYVQFVTSLTGTAQTETVPSASVKRVPLFDLMAPTD